MTEDQKRLLDAAREVAANAHAPYSRFRVGAAVLGVRGTYLGVNVENASYNLGLCAERAALAAAVTAGDRAVRGVAVFCADAGPQRDVDCVPCGGCRQWLAELAPDAWVVCASPSHEPHVFRLDDLLPHPFGLGPGAARRAP